MSERWTRRRILAGLSSLGLAVMLPGRALGATGKTVRVGMTSALSGPAQALGLGMQTGMQAWFNEVNAGGGVHGRTIELVALDDGYEPGRAAPNMRKLIDEERVFAVLGNAGTPTAAVTAPIANEKKVPLFGAFTGAGLLRKTPPERYILNYRASYAQETAEMVRGVVTELGIPARHLGFFTQNDAYGDSGYAGGKKALEAMGYADAHRLPHGRYPRNTLYIEDALSRLIDPREDVRAVIMVGAYGPCAQFIQVARKHGFDPLFMNVSFVGSDALAGKLGAGGDGVVVTQVVPHPDAALPACEAFRRLVPKEKRSFIALEGFLVARAFVLGLQLAGPDADTEAWISALEAGAPLDLGLQAPTRLSRDNHQLSNQIWPTVLRGGGFVALDRWADLGVTP